MFKPFKTRRRRFAALLLAVPIAAGAVGVAAYLLSPSTSTSSTTAGTVATPASVVLTAVASGPSGAWTLGESQVYSISLTNPLTSTGPVSINSVNLSTWSSNLTGCSPAALPGSFVGTADSSGGTLNAGASRTYQPTIKFVDTGIDQSACRGAAITLTFTSS
jgi:hypothetical protein